MEGPLAERGATLARQSDVLAAPDRGEPKFEQIMARTRIYRRATSASATSSSLLARLAKS
eukprot:5066352-Pyramimonas_sp.AAC.1